MKLWKYSNVPIVGRWIPLSEEENSIVLATLTDIQKANIENGGWAKVSYRVGHIVWPNQTIRKGPVWK